ncbi:MAG: spore coat protein CotJB, partial [Clostridia bacterium]|nr:spore coat protein CotJB [Clostridia bacterium]
KFGPLTIYGNTSHEGWAWVTGPWPWEYDAN